MLRRSLLGFRPPSPSAALAALLFLACGGKIDDAPSPPTATTVATGVPNRPPPSPPGPDLQPPLRDVTTPLVVDLGAATYGQEVTLTVPAGALGFNVVVESADGTTSVVGIERITSPSGERVHDAYTPKGGSHATSESSFGTIASASVPQSEAKSANTPEPGTWTIRIGGGTTAPPPPPPSPPPLDAGIDVDAGTGGGPAFHVTARIQLGSSSGFAGGRLDMNVFVPSGLALGTKTLDAKSAATDEGIETRLNAFYKALEARVGIDRGDVKFFAVSSELRFVDSEAALVEAFRSSSGHPDAQALNVMLSNTIDLGDGNAAWGIAPGIPGAATRTGTPMSGIVLAVGDTPAVGDGLTILHEGGHFIGLNHTTEFSGGLADPLSDTPKCDTLSLDDPSTFTSCPDHTNVMFPAFYGAAGSAVDVSDAQRAVYRGSPIYKAYKTAITTKSTRSFTSVADLARPGERTTLTKSGRALTPVETWLSATLCSHARLDPAALARARGRDATIAALRAASLDSDLPVVMRKKAAGALRTLGASP
jgi:hypothetical protein